MVNIAVLGIATGLLNPALSRVGSESISITFVTGTLSRLGRHLALAAKGAPLAGPTGAAARLRIPSSTLASRIKALKIRRSQFKFS